MNTTVPISPPITPKSFHLKSPIEESIELPSLVGRLSSPPYIPSDQRRKSNARRYSKVMALPDNDVLSYTGRSKKKAIPRRSPSPHIQGSFMMDVYDGVLNYRKRRNEEMTDVTPNQPSYANILTTERHIKKAKTDAAAAYDRVDISVDDEEVFDDPRWIPDMTVFQRSPAVKVIWKGSPLSIQHLPFYDLLHPGEVTIASTLRLTPEQYLKCRRSLIMAAQEFDRMNVAFRKSDAQKCVRIDVNKTSTLWSVFNQLGWFKPSRS
ncbi:SWIRM domain-containing protein laf2 [Choanephora cucurbitarum]|uniref:SWIRM domain-containing protein laf2 n=1 Tax=Choanephora cucurbitarum TaxID=101091 RepID=A0A1C7NJL3_9FUNG|nr:SWIRM domain-containing protein laf2 [Choanephora cucurbitarum]